MLARAGAQLRKEISDRLGVDLPPLESEVTIADMHRLGFSHWDVWGGENGTQIYGKAFYRVALDPGPHDTFTVIKYFEGYCCAGDESKFLGVEIYEE